MIEVARDAWGLCMVAFGYVCVAVTIAMWAFVLVAAAAWWADDWRKALCPKKRTCP